MSGTLWEHNWLSNTACPSGRIDAAWPTIEEEEEMFTDDDRAMLKGVLRLTKDKIEPRTEQIRDDIRLHQDGTFIRRTNGQVWELKSVQGWRGALKLSRHVIPDGRTWEILGGRAINITDTEWGNIFDNYKEGDPLPRIG